MVALTDPLDVILRDGTTLRLRPPSRADGLAVLAFFGVLSDRSRYLRFHGLAAVSPALVATMLEPDWSERGALLGVLADGGGERVIAVANYARLRDPSVAEVAFAVADSHQGLGVGTRLLEQLAARAAGEGIEGFLAHVMADNAAMMEVFATVGFEVTRHLEAGEVEVRFPIAATEEYREQVARRDHTAVTASMQPFFEPRSVAVLGASPRRGSIGGELFRNILSGEFTGSAYPVNRDGVAVSAVRGYRSIGEIPDEVDLAVVCLPAGVVVDAVDEALSHGVRALVVVSAGFAETGSAGAERQERLLEVVRAHGARLIGPNCLGIAVAGPSLNATFAARAVPPGTIGFSSQSGALGLALLEAATTRGLGLSAFVSIGNKADVSTNDLLEWWEDDPATAVVLLYVESFGNPRKFGRIARRVARRKPILALKSGVSASAQRAASSHTGALAGSEAAVVALFRHAGVIRASTLEELVDVAALLSSQPEPRGRRVGILTNAGGLGILCADACEGAGLELPALGDETRTALGALLPAEAAVANPVDMLGGATAQTYAAAVPVLLADPRVDAVIVLFVPTVVATAEEVAAAIAGAVGEEPPRKPVLAVVVSADGIPAVLREQGAPVAGFSYPESAAHALGRAAARAEWLLRPQGVVPALTRIERRSAEELVGRALEHADDVWLDSSAARELLLAYGLPLVDERPVDGVDAALAAAHELGFPVVVKAATAGAHKTETGGVALDLDDGEAVRVAVERIGPPVLVQPMVRGGTELLAGLVQDPVFGPLVAFGPGGVQAELIGQAAFRIAPLTDVDAAELVTDGKAGVLVRGFRGAPALDTSALEDVLHRLARLGEDLPAVAELDLNPVLGFPERCVVVDWRVRIRRPPPHPGPKTW